MDNAGWHAFRRAQRNDEFYQNPQRGPDGRYEPIQHVDPMNNGIVGGFDPRVNYNAHILPHQHNARTGPPPPLPPRPLGGERTQSDSAYRCDSPQSPQSLHGPGVLTGSFYRQYSQQSVASSYGGSLARLSAVERSHILRSVRMDPHLQLMAGPLLRYDTIDSNGVWYGACLVVTADGGSVYEPLPMLVYEWDPAAPSRSRSAYKQPGSTFDLGPHPADPHTSVSLSEVDAYTSKSPTRRVEHVPGHEIWVYEGMGGTYTFWRFLIQIPLGPSEMVIKYAINNGQPLEFFVPGRHQEMRCAAYSCNGFSAGVNPDDFRGPGFKSGYDPVWIDLLNKHTEAPYHVLVGGGDQLYCDGIIREPELQEWIKLKDPAMKLRYEVSEEFRQSVDRYFFSHYCQMFRSGAFARANCSIPMVNMADDHDIIDGYGSYPDDLQMSPVFRLIGSRGYFFFLLFQCFINVDVDGRDDGPGVHAFKSLIIGGNGPYVPYPSHSFLAYLGPRTYILMLDCRAERRKDQVCSVTEYQKVFERLDALPRQVEHLILQLGIPIAYPRLTFLENFLDSKMNPLVALGRKGAMGMTSFVNKFNSEAELLDDLNDHWTAKGHKEERNNLVVQLQMYAMRSHTRVTFLSGDVHCAAVGVFKTLVGKKQSDIEPTRDHRFMLNVITSAIVNTPPPSGVITLVDSRATKVHTTLHHCDTDETMVPIFIVDTNGSPSSSKYVMQRRNWCSITFDYRTGELIFDIRVEKEKGIGVTVGYPIRAPPPRWNDPNVVGIPN